MLPWCAAHGTGVIAYSPMMSGLLSGRFSHERMDSLDGGDWRRGFPAFQEPELSRNLGPDALDEIAVAIARTGAGTGPSRPQDGPR